MDSDNILSFDDLSDVFEQLKNMEDVKVEETPEEIASQKRYEEIIKKHKNEEI